MTLAKARRVTGLDIRRIDKTTWGAWNEENNKVAEASHRKDSIALTLLVNAVYRVRAEQAMELAGWRCSRCGGYKPLQTHHREYRSHGRDDRMGNLEPLCSDCHEAEHRKGKRVA